MSDDWRAIARARARELKIRDKLTQDDLADRVGVSQGTLSAWLGGHRNPRLQNLIDLEQALELPRGALLATHDTPQSGPYVAALLDLNAIAAALRGLDDAAERGELSPDYETRARLFARAYSLHILSDE